MIFGIFRITWPHFSCLRQAYHTVRNRAVLFTFSETSSSDVLLQKEKKKYKETHKEAFVLYAGSKLVISFAWFCSFIIYSSQVADPGDIIGQTSFELLTNSEKEKN